MRPLGNGTAHAAFSTKSRADAAQGVQRSTRALRRLQVHRQAQPRCARSKRTWRRCTSTTSRSTSAKKRIRVPSWTNCGCRRSSGSYSDRGLEHKIRRAFLIGQHEGESRAFWRIQSGYFPASFFGGNLPKVSSFVAAVPQLEAVLASHGHYAARGVELWELLVGLRSLRLWTGAGCLAVGTVASPWHDSRKGYVRAGRFGPASALAFVASMLALLVAVLLGVPAMA